MQQDLPQASPANPVAVAETSASAAERLILEQAHAFAQELLRVAHDAPDGQVLKLAELFVLDRGRELLRSSLTHALQAQAEAVEKKGRPLVTVPAGTDATTRAPPRNNA